MTHQCYSVTYNIIDCVKENCLQMVCVYTVPI